LYFIETLSLVVPRVAVAGIVIVPDAEVAVDVAFVQTVSPESAKSPS
jgi:hypothetical protein